MSVLEKLKIEMNGLQERFLDRDGNSMSAILDPSSIPNDMSDLASMEHGRIDTPNAEGNSIKPDEVPSDNAEIEMPEIDADESEADIKEMDSAQVKESLSLALDVAFECVQKSQMILKTLVGGGGKANLKDVVDKDMLEKANDVVEEYIELVEYMEEVDSDDSAEEEEPEGPAGEPEVEPTDEPTEEPEAKPEDSDEEE